MSQVFLVRHGQASFSEPNYDKLSANGEAQARLLGEYWARHKVNFNRVCSGPRVRQLETARIVGEAFKGAGLAFRQPVVMREFDEYHGDAVLERSLPGLMEKDKSVRDLNAAYQKSSNPPERAKTFQKLFETVIGTWVNGDLPHADIESWPEFCARVNRGLSEFISSGGRGERVAIFCSGGPIAVAMQRALNLSPADTLRVAWMVRNGSYSEFLCSGDRFTLSTFNAFPHLDGTSLLTYR